MTTFTNITSITGAFAWANNLTGGFIGIGFPIVVWVALFAAGISHGRGHGITFASFVTGILLLMENMMGWVQFWVITADLILLVIGVYMMLQERRSFEV
jgi:general stress protein CsbA